MKCVSWEGPGQPSSPLLSVMAGGKSGSKPRSKRTMNAPAQLPLRLRCVSFRIHRQECHLVLRTACSAEDEFKVQKQQEPPSELRPGEWQSRDLGSNLLPGSLCRALSPPVSHFPESLPHQQGQGSCGRRKLREDGPSTGFSFLFFLISISMKLFLNPLFLKVP